jgi:hypothetical protein
MILKKYSREQLETAISSSFCVRETLSKLGISPSGGNYQTLKKAICFFNIDNSHFTGQGHLKGKTHNYNTRPLKEVLVFGKYENTYRLKNRLIKENLKDKKCENCLMISWQGVSIPLELHHKDGNRKNNLFSNLELLCPNCHALTDNYRGKNKKI